MSKRQAKVTKKAVDSISFQVKAGEIVGIVGESGAGKTVTAHSILGLLHESSTTKIEGTLTWKGEKFPEMSAKSLRKLRGKEISIIFQDAATSLNPILTIGNQLIETLRIHQKFGKQTAKVKAVEILKGIGIHEPEDRMRDYSWQLSAGMRQRVLFAMAVACKAELLIADEPTTALDITIQSQLLDSLVELNRNGMAIIIITHDISVIARICHKVIVMHSGRIVESGNIHTIFEHAKHPITKKLILEAKKLAGMDY